MYTILWAMTLMATHYPMPAAPLVSAMSLANTVYTLPNLVPQNAGSSLNRSINRNRFLSNPQMQGEYNFTIKITEWRNGFEIGYVIRDVQLTVTSQCPNNPPQF